MKTKLFYFLIASLFVLNSCSGDTDGRDIEPIKDIKTEPKKENQVLLKKTIQTDSDGDKVITKYAYNGSKLLSITFEGEIGGLYLTYSGDLISRMEFEYDGEIEQINLYEYDSKGKLVTFKRIEPIENRGNKEIYTYNADGTISVVQYKGDSKTQTQKNGTSIITFLNGEVDEIVSTHSPNFKYTYDTKNNPFKNILGYDKINFVDGEAEGILHNRISQVLVYGDVTATMTSKITYNADGYPQKSFDNFENVKGTTTEYFY